MTKLDETARGVYVIAPTPFDEDGDLDFASIDTMVDFYIERGATGLTVLGIMGEANKVTASEARFFLHRLIARVGGRVPVIVGVSSPGFAPMRQLADAAMDAGAAGVMVAPTPNLRSDDQIFGYFRDTAEILGDIPWVLQDYPLTLGVQIPVSVINRCVRELPTMVMLKHEDWPGLNKITAIRTAEAAGQRRISILCGNGGLFLTEEMARGADGAMTGFAYPEMMAAVVGAFDKGDPERARDLFDAYLPLARYEQQQGVGLAARKYVLAKRGAIRFGTMRKPATKLTVADIQEIETLIARQERRLKALG